MIRDFYGSSLVSNSVIKNPIFDDQVGAMVEDRKLVIDKFDRSNFGF